MGNVPSSKFSVFSENEYDLNTEENRLQNIENSNTSHSAINRQNSKENVRRENLVEGENSHATSDLCSVFKQSCSDLNHLSERNRQNLEEFEKELSQKQEQRREILAAKKKQMEDLRNEIKLLREENAALKKIHLEDENVKEELKRLKEIKLVPNTQNMSKETDPTGSCYIQNLNQENSRLRDELADKEQQLKDINKILEKNKELRISIAEMQCELQNLNKVVVDFEQEREEYKTHVVALKDVINVSKKMLLIREGQLRELRQKVESIEETLSGKEMNILSQDLRLEYERQLQSIRNLKTLYEERQRSDQREKEDLKLLLDETRKELESEKKKREESEERVKELEEQNSQKYDEIKSLESNLGLSKAECRQYQAELTVINQLFSEILLGFNTNQEIDLDRLTKHLEDHHGLLKEIVINEISPASSSALPKTLLDLLSQLHESKESQKAFDDADKSDDNLKTNRLATITEESESQTSSYNINSAEEIVELLPKVWRVLIELLSHQKVPTNILTEEKQPNDENPCYKTVQTAKGPSLVLSVSQTFIRLKDLILEKKSLEKETGHLKQLNGHLETRLQDQEKRLQMVSNELNKTWHVVGKLQKQHQLLHTQEKILRYELAQKRKLLSTLKEELEYSREKWQQAREKNSTTEKQWKQLRGEFAARRNIVTEDFNNSVESGYSDEKCSSSDDEVEKGYESDISEGSPKHTDKNDSENEGVNKETAENAAQVDKSQEITADNKESDTKDIDIIACNHTTEFLKNDQKELSNTSLSNTSPPETANSQSQNESINENITHNNPTKSVTDVIYEELEQLLKHEENLVKTPKIVHSNEENASGMQSKTKSNDVSSSGSKFEKHSVVEEIWAVKNDILNTKADKLLKDNESSQASTDIPTTSSAKPKRTLEEILAAKEERLKRLEGQCKQLVDKVTNTENKRQVISNKLDGLHETYGEKSTSNSVDVEEEKLDEDNKTKDSNKGEGD